MILPVIVDFFSLRCPPMTEHEAANAWLPFLVDEKDLARAFKVSKVHIGRLFNAGELDEFEPVQLSEKVIRFKGRAVERYFNAPLHEVMPWLVAQKEPA